MPLHIPLGLSLSKDEPRRSWFDKAHHERFDKAHHERFDKLTTRFDKLTTSGMSPMSRTQHIWHSLNGSRRIAVLSPQNSIRRPGEMMRPTRRYVGFCQLAP